MAYPKPLFVIDPPISSGRRLGGTAFRLDCGQTVIPLLEGGGGLEVDLRELPNNPVFRGLGIELLGSADRTVAKVLADCCEFRVCMIEVVHCMAVSQQVRRGF